MGQNLLDILFKLSQEKFVVRLANDEFILAKKGKHMSIKGKVKWFNGAKGYGFIEREDKAKDVFVHSSAAREANLELQEGDELTFEVENGEKGPSAVNLQKV